MKMKMKMMTSKETDLFYINRLQSIFSYEEDALESTKRLYIKGSYTLEEFQDRVDLILRTKLPHKPPSKFSNYRFKKQTTITRALISWALTWAVIFGIVLLIVGLTKLL